MDAATTFPAPDSLDDAQAASLFVGYQTSWFALHRRTQIRSGDILLVHAAAGGVGSSAVQLGKAAGATVIGVVGGGEGVAPRPRSPAPSEPTSSSTATSRTSSRWSSRSPKMRLQALQRGRREIYSKAGIKCTTN